MRSVVTRPSPDKQDTAKSLKTGDVSTPHVVKPKSQVHRAFKIGRHAKVERHRHLESAQLSHKPKKVLTGEVISSKSVTSQTATTFEPLPSLVASASRIEQMLDEVLLSSHQQSRKKRGNKKLLSRLNPLSNITAAIGLIFITVIVAGLFAWKNVPQVAVTVAGTRAQLSASVPKYAPDGFRFVSPVSYSNGVVKVKYKGAGGASYEITQQKSKRDSTALASDMLSGHSNVQTSQVKGSTVYIYGDSNATWVNKGIHYTISDNASLSSDQLLKIAESL